LFPQSASLAVSATGRAVRQLPFFFNLAVSTSFIKNFPYDFDREAAA
jgi:hypothetical protein